MEDEDYEDYQVYFVGYCNCTHGQEEHGWGECGVNDCKCEAGYEE